jgi:signal transduction histidine kinase
MRFAAPRPISLRTRLAILFAAGSAVTLLLTALLLWHSLNGELNAAIGNGLEGRADDIVAVFRSRGQAVPEQDPFAQVIGPTGRVLASSTTVGDRRLLDEQELHSARVAPITIDRSVRGLGTDARLLAVPERTGPATAVVVVGTSLETVRRAQHRLALILVVVGPTLITLLAVGGWLLAHAALRPVGRMTKEADTMSLTEPGRRLRQPPGDDEIARLGRTLNTMLERMEASFAREKAFVDDASHELRTPISILRGELELALAQPGSRADTERTLRSALEEAERLGRLAEDLLVLARSTSGDLPLRRDRVDVHAVVERVAGRLATDGPPIVEIEGDHVAVDADLLRVEQVATNLITNARRFALDRVLVTIGLSRGEVEIVVSDDGPGFAVPLLPVVFDRFTRSDAARGRGEGGTGLGLAIVAALVRAHGGTVEAANGAPLGGAVVRVRLPRADP